MNMQEHSELAEGGAQTALILTRNTGPSQQDADSLVEQGWKPIPQALTQLVEGANQYQ
jgi:hypothetical protein